MCCTTTHSLTYSLAHSLTHSHTHTRTHTRTLACLLACSLTHSQTHSITHPCSLAHSHSLTISLTHKSNSLSYSTITCLIEYSLNPLLTHWIAQLLVHYSSCHSKMNIEPLCINHLTPQYKAIIINSCNTFCLILSFFIRPEDVCSQPVLSSSLSSSWSMWLSRRDFSLDTEEDGGLGVVPVSWFLLARTFHFLISVLAISPNSSSSLRNWFTVLPIPVALRFKCEFISLLNMFNKRGVSALSWSFRCFKHNAVALTVPINTRSLTTCR